MDGRGDDREDHARAADLAAALAAARAAPHAARASRAAPHAVRGAGGARGQAAGQKHSGGANSRERGQGGIKARPPHAAYAPAEAADPVSDAAPRAPEKLRVTGYFAKRMPHCATPEVRAASAAQGEADAAIAPETDPEAARRDAGFAEVAARVSRAKSALDAIDARELYMTMSSLDLYAPAREPLRQALGAPVVTNATMKMYEILERADIVPRVAPRVRAFCNAELPGAFLVAVNAYVRGRGGSLDWVASSYAPEAAAEAGDAGDVFGDDYGLYSGNRDRWLMGPPPNARLPGAPPLSGDVTDPAVVRALAADVHRRFAADAPGVESGATLYTSDAGIDVSADYNRQEELTALLNFGQILSGLLALAPGGALVTKQYTFTTRFSRELIALLAGVFDRVDVSKPLTSRPANSEVYLVASGFAGLEAATAEALLGRLAEFRAGAGRGRTPCDAPSLLAVPCPAADAVLLRAAREVHGDTQVAFLEEAARWHAAYFGQGARPGAALAALRAAVAPASADAVAEWIRRHPLPTLGPEDQLPAGPRQEKSRRPLRGAAPAPESAPAV